MRLLPACLLAAETYRGRFSENAYGDGIAERKAKEARLVAEERLPNLQAKLLDGFEIPAPSFTITLIEAVCSHRWRS
jgi:hypothetical protein